MANQSPRDKLTSYDKELLRYLDTVGFSSPMVMALKMGRSSRSVQESLTRFHLVNEIFRPIKGLVFSRRWLEKHPHKRAEIEEALEIVFPIA